MSRISEVDAVQSEDVKPNWLLVRFIKRHLEDLKLLTFAFIVTISCCIYYLSTMLTISDPGLTLDDSWIHIQFAHTIFEGIPWEYSHGYPSTGSTSPLWSVILASIFFFTSDQFGIVWGTYAISTAFFIGSTFLAGRIVANYLEHSGWGYFTMIAFVIIPRNAWMMLSGMETPLFVFILLLSIWILDKEEMKYDLLIGVIAGFAYLSRPEGIIVAFCIPIRFIMIAMRGKASIKRLGLFILSGVFAVIVVSPWVLHCLSTTGYLLPDTFYAKVHTPTTFEIAAWDDHWMTRFVIEMPHILVAVFLGVILILKGKPFAWLLPVTLTVLYRLFTPYAALINNARYLVPVFDLFIVVAIASSAILFKFILVRLLEMKDRLSLNLLGIFLLALVIVNPMLTHYVWQTTNYGKAAGNINDMQVHLGYWLDENTPPDAVFATHDVGALRFFSGRTMIDLGGLVSPDIIHENMTKHEIMQYLCDNGCNYMVFFDELFVSWAYYIPFAYSRIYTVFLDDNVVCGRDRMSVYQIFWDQTEFPANNP